MKRKRNDGKRDGGNTWSDSLGSERPERVQGALHVTYNPLIEGKQLKMFNRTFV